MTSPMRSLPLRWRLSIITATITLVAVAISSAVVLTLVRDSMVRQIDYELAEASHTPMINRPGDPGDDRRGPTDYFIAVIEDEVAYVWSEPTTADGATPELPLPQSVTPGEPITVDSADGAGPRWRIAYFAQPGNAYVVVVALPLTYVTSTTAAMLRIMILVGLAVVTVAAVAGYLAVQWSLRPLRDIEDAAQAVATGDLTRRAPLQPASTEVGRLGLSFNTMVAELEEAFAEREESEARMRRFVSDASHELRTPLASIRGYGELYRMGAVPDEDVPATLARIENEATRMGGLVNDLLALARLDEGRGLRLGEIDLAAVASDGVADLGALDPSREVRLIADGLVPVRADGDRIRQVVTNLIGNTAAHTPAGSPVELAVRAETADDGEYAVLEVCDHGPGIKEADSARIFERFYRPDSSRARVSGGSGLGLAIVATIVAAHGGTVRHVPTAGGGATIVVRLPVAGPAGADAGH